MKIYHIYGRTNYADPLTLIEEISIDNDTPIAQIVLDQHSAIEHSADEWVELVAIPNDKIIWARKTEADA